MAGLTPMGDLTHELETLVLQIDSGAIPANEAAFDVMQSSLDELAQMRGVVANGQPPGSARKAIARIKSLSGLPEVAAAPAAQPAVKEVPAPPAATVAPVMSAAAPAAPPPPGLGAIASPPVFEPAPAEPFSMVEPEEESIVMVG
jgi:chemosensory pili system protein ChpA (sensor histidine kinase/response regulator)